MILLYFCLPCGDHCASEQTGI
ncbi:hypothetical protein ID866_6011 [Astraeus odoratus]|nr:hypothetical protein ID866_6011 [Astraeus odoratus]